MSLDWTIVTTDRLAGMAPIVIKSPVFRLWKSGNPSRRSRDDGCRDGSCVAEPVMNFTLNFN